MGTTNILQVVSVLLVIEQTLLSTNSVGCLLMSGWRPSEAVYRFGTTVRQAPSCSQFFLGVWTAEKVRPNFVCFAFMALLLIL